MAILSCTVPDVALPRIRAALAAHGYKAGDGSVGAREVDRYFKDQLRGAVAVYERELAEATARTNAQLAADSIG